MIDVIHGNCITITWVNLAHQNALSLLSRSMPSADTQRPPNSPSANVLTEYVERGAFPGAAYGILYRGQIAELGSVGRFTYDPASPPTETETSFDLASVSKVVATTAMATLLWQRGVLQLETPLFDLLPEFVAHAPAEQRAERQRVTLRTLLGHSSGLPGYAPLFQTERTAEALYHAALRLPLQATPGERAEYSDIGFILFGKALEALAGESIETFCTREIFAPLGMAETRYCPAVGERSSIPPTEDDKDFRGHVVQGVVHDENCYVLGGIAGHAGLFAPAVDVLRFAGAMLQPLRDPRVDTLFTPDAVRLFTARTGVPGSSRALGWDTPSGSPSSSGDFFNGGSFGHLGYTGTSLWVDPVRDCAVVLLTNRTFPTRENKRIAKARPDFHNVVVKSLEGNDFCHEQQSY